MEKCHKLEIVCKMAAQVHMEFEKKLTLTEDVRPFGKVS